MVLSPRNVKGFGTAWTAIHKIFRDPRHNGLLVTSSLPRINREVLQKLLQSDQDLIRALVPVEALSPLLLEQVRVLDDLGLDEIILELAMNPRDRVVVQCLWIRTEEGLFGILADPSRNGGQILVLLVQDFLLGLAEEILEILNEHGIFLGVFLFKVHLELDHVPEIRHTDRTEEAFTYLTHYYRYYNVFFTSLIMTTNAFKLSFLSFFISSNNY